MSHVAGATVSGLTCHHNTVLEHCPIGVEHSATFQPSRAVFSGGLQLALARLMLDSLYSLTSTRPYDLRVAPIAGSYAHIAIVTYSQIAHA